LQSLEGMLRLSKRARVVILRVGGDSLREAGVLWLTFGSLEGVIRSPNIPWGNWWFPTTIFVGMFFIFSGAIVAVRVEGGSRRDER
jgi:hypothetical protein